MEKFVLSFESAEKALEGYSNVTAPTYDVKRNTGDYAVNGGGLANGTKFIVVRNSTNYINDDSARETTAVAMLDIVTTEGAPMSISAGALGGSIKLKAGGKCSPETVCLETSKRAKLAYKRVIGTKLSALASKLHEVYGKEQVYECVGVKEVTKEESNNGFAKTIYAIVLAD